MPHWASSISPVCPTAGVTSPRQELLFYKSCVMHMLSSMEFRIQTQSVLREFAARRVCKHIAELYFSVLCLDDSLFGEHLEEEHASREKKLSMVIFLIFVHKKCVDD